MSTTAPAPIKIQLVATAKGTKSHLTIEGFAHTICGTNSYRLRLIDTADTAQAFEGRVTCAHCAGTKGLAVADARTVKAAEQAAAEAAHTARLAEQADAYTAGISAELDAALRAFCASPSRETFGALRNVQPEGFNLARRADELGIGDAYRAA